MQLALATCRVDLDKATVHHPDRRDQRLSAHEVGLLRYLAGRPGQVVSRDELLREVWGYHPDVATRAVDLAMARLRRKVEALPRQPVHLTTIYGEGYRFVAPSASAPIAPARDRFVGREGLLAQLEAWSGRLLTLTGPPGIGKTRLALAWASGRPAVVVEASEGTETPWLQQVAGALGSTDLPPDAAAARDHVVALLHGRGAVLLVLDDADLAAEAPATVAHWLDEVPQLRCLVTSRGRLGLRGEQVIDVPPLPAAEVEALLVDRCGRSLGEVGELVRALDGIPLAIELAAGRLRARTPKQLLDDLRRRGPLAALGKGGVDGPDRHRTLELAIATSWDALGPDERALWMAASRFERGFDAEHLAFVVDRPVGEVLDGLEALVDASVVSTDEPESLPGELRMHLLDALKAFGRARDDGGARPRFVTAMAAFAEHAGDALYGPDGLEVAARLDVELANLTGALREAITLGNGTAASQLLPVFVMTPVARPMGLRPLMEQVLTLPLDVGSEARVRKAEASLCFYEGLHPQAVEALRIAVERAEACDDLPLLRRCRSNLGAMLASMGEPEEGLQQLLAAHDVGVREGNREGMAYTAVEVGRRLRLTGDVEGSRRWMEQADALSRAVGRPPMLEVRRLSVQAELLVELGDVEAATAMVRSLRDLYDHPRLQYLTAVDLGRTAHAAGRLDEACDELRTAVDVAIGAAYGPRRDEARLFLADALLDRGDVPEAIELARDVLAVDAIPSDGRAAASALLAEALARTGALEEAARRLASAQALREAASVSVQQEIALRDAAMHAARGDVDKGRDVARQLGELPPILAARRLRWFGE